MRKERYQPDNDGFLKKVGETIKFYRQLKGYSLKDVGLSSDVSHIERGHVNITLLKLKQIAETLDEPIWHLIYDAEEGGEG